MALLRLREAGSRYFKITPKSSPEMTIVEERTQEVTESKGQTANPAHLANMMTAFKAQRDLCGLEPKGDGPAASVIVNVYGGCQGLQEIV